jgi:peptidoglycan/LPS O-acetylase OafA/YrhL
MATFDARGQSAQPFGSGVRLKPLDGLRGIAAAVVVMHHCLLLIPAISAVQFGQQEDSVLANILAFSPLHIFWAGGEAVYLFFVLSGLVLAFQAQRTGFDWASYYPSRLVRIYLPVAAAVAFQLVAILIVPRNTGPQPSQWVNSHINEYSYGGVVSDLTLIGGISHVNSPLWSLAWEIFFSVLLPAYIAVALKVRPGLLFLGSLVLIAVGATSQTTALLYLPMFGLGVSLAFGWDNLSLAAGRLNRQRHAPAVWLIVFSASICATLNQWLLSPLLGGSTPWNIPIAMMGVTGITVVAAFSPLASRLLSLPAALWLGRISFSLYLIHEPIVMSMAFLFPTQPRLAILAAVVIAVPMAWLFFQFVERPIHRLSQNIRRDAGSRASGARRGTANT